MKTWLMYRDYYGRAIPTPQHQSNFRKNLEELRTSKHPKRSGHRKPKRIPGFTVNNFIKEIVLILLGGILFIGLLFWLFPGIAAFFNL